MKVIYSFILNFLGVRGILVYVDWIVFVLYIFSFLNVVLEVIFSFYYRFLDLCLVYYFGFWKGKRKVW